MTSALTDDYSFLISLWSQWLSRPEWQPLDRWLKSRKFSPLVNKTSKSSTAMSDPMQAGVAMHAAMRFMQLACALNDAWRNPDKKMDYRSWDEKWQWRDVRHIKPAELWYWIALRAAEDNIASVHAPKNLRDAEQRKQFFTSWKAQAGADSENILYWLWQGLRPGWKPLLDDRAKESQWNKKFYLDFLAGQTITPPLWLRLQNGADGATVVQHLQEDGIRAACSADGVSVHGGKNIISSRDYGAGKFEIQDAASQQIAAAVQVKPGQKVWDCCAGAGGKTLAIAAQMQNKGVVVATDLHTFKLEEIKRRARRGGFYNIRTFGWDGEESLRLPAEVARQSGFDWVLVDAPCSSSGTWRRNPDARWHFDVKEMSTLLMLQEQLLHQASTSTRVGGSLVYATCSWCVAENENQIKKFLAAHTNFSLVSQTITGSPLKNSDTMFVAVMQRGVNDFIS